MLSKYTCVGIGGGRVGVGSREDGQGRDADEGRVVCCAERVVEFGGTVMALVNALRGITGVRSQGTNHPCAGHPQAEPGGGTCPRRG